MTMLEWAENEVNLFTQEENEDDDKYVNSCAKSALRAFNCLMEDGHSGMSIGITHSILNRLIEGKPLMPITEDDFEDEPISPNKKSYQCKRMSSLFKDVDVDENITYSDINRVSCIDKDSGVSFSSGVGTGIIDKLFPIELPYNPPVRPFIIEYASGLINPELGDYDIEAFYRVITPSGENIPLNKFYQYVKEDGKEKRKEITHEEFESLKEQSDKNKEEK